MINSVLTSLRTNQLEKKLKKKYGLSEAEAKEILRQGKAEAATQSKKSNNQKGKRDSMENLKEFCEERLRHHPSKVGNKSSTSDHDKGDAKNSQPHDSADCSGTVAWSNKSDTETNSAWGNSPARSTDDSSNPSSPSEPMSPPGQIFPLHKYMHQEDAGTTDNTLKMKTNEEDPPLPCNISDANKEYLPPTPTMLLTIQSGELLSENVAEITESSPVERKLNYGEEEETDNDVKPNENAEQHSGQAVKIATHSNESPCSTLMAFLEHPSRRDIPSGPPSLGSSRSKDPVKRSVLPSTDFNQNLSHTPQTVNCATTPLSPSPNVNPDPQVHQTCQLVDSTERKDEAPHHQQQDEEVSVMTREEEPEVAVEVIADESPAKVNPKVKRKVKQLNIPRIIFVHDPPEIEVPPFTDEEGFVIKREKRLAPIERLSL